MAKKDKQSFYDKVHANGGKHWNYQCVIYEDSAPKDWISIIRSWGENALISPYHDKDKHDDGSDKKPHYHVILCYNGPTALSVVEKLTRQLGQPNPQAIENVKGYYRYLSHKDNPEKAQYDENEIETLNGFNVADYSDLTRSEVLEVKQRIIAIIRSCDIIEYCDLMDMLLDDGMMLEWEVASSHTFFFEKYITSRRYKMIREGLKAQYRFLMILAKENTPLTNSTPYDTVIHTKTPLICCFVVGRTAT